MARIYAQKQSPVQSAVNFIAEIENIVLSKPRWHYQTFCRPLCTTVAPANTLYLFLRESMGLEQPENIFAKMRLGLISSRGIVHFYHGR